VSVPVGQGLALVRAAAIPAPSLAEVLLLFEQQIGLVPPPARGRCEKRIGAVLSLRPLAALQARGCAHAVGPRAVAELGPRAVAERRRCGFGRNVRELDFGRDPALKRSQLSSTVAETLERATNLSAPGPLSEISYPFLAVAPNLTNEENRNSIGCRQVAFPSAWSFPGFNGERSSGDGVIGVGRTTAPEMASHVAAVR
jgi:hypothetical protein